MAGAGGGACGAAAAALGVGHTQRKLRHCCPHHHLVCMSRGRIHRVVNNDQNERLSECARKEGGGNDLAMQPAEGQAPLTCVSAAAAGISHPCASNLPLHYAQPHCTLQLPPEVVCSSSLPSSLVASSSPSATTPPPPPPPPPPPGTAAAAVVAG